MACRRQRADCAQIRGCAENARARTGSSAGRAPGCRRPRCRSSAPVRFPGNSLWRFLSAARILNRACSAGSSGQACQTTTCRRSGRSRGDRPPPARCPACSDRGKPRAARRGRDHQDCDRSRAATRRGRAGSVSFPPGEPGSARARGHTRANALRLPAWSWRLCSLGTMR